MTDDTLPPLPEPAAFGSYTSCDKCSPYQAPIFTADQMREYAMQAVRAEREAVLDLCRQYAKNNTDLRGAIRARSQHD